MGLLNISASTLITLYGKTNVAASKKLASVVRSVTRVRYRNIF